MATTALPFTAGGSARPGAPSALTTTLPPAEELIDAMSMTRTGLFFITIIAVVTIAVAIMNVMWGAGTTAATTAASTDGRTNEGEAKKYKGYANKMRDYVILAGSIFILLSSLFSIYKTYPKMR